MIIDLYANSKLLYLRNLVNTHYDTYRREEFFSALKKIYHEEMGENLPIYGVVI